MVKMYYLCIIRNKQSLTKRFRVMKANIKTLLGAWVKDNRSYIEESNMTIKEYILECLNAENWKYDFFTDEEIECKSDEKLRDEVEEFAWDYEDIIPAEFLGEIDDILHCSEDCDMITEVTENMEWVAYDSWVADCEAFGDYTQIFGRVIEKGGTIKQFAKYYGFKVFKNEEAEQLEVYKTK